MLRVVPSPALDIQGGEVGLCGFVGFGVGGGRGKRDDMLLKSLRVAFFSLSCTCSSLPPLIHQRARFHCVQLKMCFSVCVCVKAYVCI